MTTKTHVAVAIVAMVTVTVSEETNIPVTLMHGRRKAKLILALIGLILEKYVELRQY